MARRPKPISSFLSQPSVLPDQLVRHSGYLRSLSKILENTLPLALKKHCTLANYKENILVVHADSPVWASRLRFEIPALQQKLVQNPSFTGLRQIEVYTSGGASPICIKPQSRPSLSHTAAEVVLQVADQVNDSNLAAALRRLAKRADKP